MRRTASFNAILQKVANWIRTTENNSWDRGDFVKYRLAREEEGPGGDDETTESRPPASTQQPASSEEGGGTQQMGERRPLRSRSAVDHFARDPEHSGRVRAALEERLRAEYADEKARVTNRMKEHQAVARKLFYELSLEEQEEYARNAEEEDERLDRLRVGDEAMLE